MFSIRVVFFRWVLPSPGLVLLSLVRENDMSDFFHCTHTSYCRRDYSTSLRMYLGSGICLLTMWCLHQLATVSCITDNPVVTGSTDAPARPECWVYLHMNKSGGSTVRFLIKSWADQQKIKQRLYGCSQWAQGSATSRRLVHSQVSLVYGGYTEGLRPYERVGDECKWFTVFRHPFSRLVSAYYYCKRTGDQLCAHQTIDMKHMDLVSFAEHWGNYGLRQFALSQLSWEEVNASRAAKNCKRCSAWFKVKLYLKEQEANSPSNNSSSMLNDEGLERFLEPAQELIGNKYAAVGLLEEFNATLRMFTRALEMPGMDWVALYKSAGSKNVHRAESAERAATVRLAWTDPSIREYISLDLLLYEHAEAVHARQVAQYGLVT